MFRIFGVRRVCACLCVSVGSFLCLPSLSTAGTVPRDAIAAAVENAVRERVASSGLEAEIAVPHAREVEVAGTKSPEIRAELISPKLRGGTVSVRVEFRKGDQLLSRAHFVAHVRIFGTVVVTTREINRGDTLRAADLALQRVELEDMSGFFRSTDEAAGMCARYTIKSGDILRTVMVRPVPIVRRGDAVTIRAISGGVALASEGVVRQDGGRGELIRVYSTMSRKSVICRVVDETTVMAGKERVQ